MTETDEKKVREALRNEARARARGQRFLTKPPLGVELERLASERAKEAGK